MVSDLTAGRPRWWPSFWTEGGGIGPTDDILRESIVDTLPPPTLSDESFASAQGDGAQYDHIFEQLRLKKEKGKIMCLYASSEGCIACWHGMLGLILRKEKKDCGKAKHAQEPARPVDVEVIPTWIGNTLQKRACGGEGPGWSPGRGTGVTVRALPRPCRHDALRSLDFGSMYECVSCDAITSTSPITDVMGRLVQVSQIPVISSESSVPVIAWTEECALPRIICMNVMLPYTGERNDPGCSYVCLFHIRPQVLAMLQSGVPAPCITHFQRFCNRPAGMPSETPLDTDLASARSLFSRRNATVSVNDDSGLVKVVGYCENVDDLGLGWAKRKLLSQFNGKPVTITKSGYIVKQTPNAPGEWLEIGVDVKGPYFNRMVRYELCSNKEMFGRAEAHICLIIQAVENGELPEGLVLDVHLHGVSMSGLRQI